MRGEVLLEQCDSLNKGFGLDIADSIPDEIAFCEFIDENLIRTCVLNNSNIQITT
jgi:hypothetical protein